NDPAFVIDGITNWESTDENYPGKKEIIVSAILRNTISNNAKQRKIEVSGDQINETDGSLKMSAINGQRTIEMTDQGIYIDAGKDNDITLQCRKFFLKNEDEDNITYGEDFMAHFGRNTELFYGDSYSDYYGHSEEQFRGDKTEEFHGNKYESMFGLHESISVANDFELFVGGKEELSFIEHFEFFLGFHQTINVAASLDCYFGPQVETRVGPKLVNNPSPEIEMKNLTFKKNALAVLSSGLVILS
ncbi:MAG: hypothetical protein KAT15_25630, partial [Bacteroidales bacterium]|nr:hypothetical protein [Bacteroidales bacterium]